MDFVIGVSWPRSGHHMLVRLLQLYFGDAFGYCDVYGGKPWVEDIKTCCGKVPCKYPNRINLTKSHDFKLDMKQIKGVKYLVQYRDFVPSVVSNFELLVRKGGEDSEIAFRKFASAEFSRYLGFIDKWVASDFGQGQLLLNYRNFLEDPAGELARTIGYFDPNAEIDHERISWVIAEVDGQRIEKGKVLPLRKSGVHGDRDVRRFRYYTPHLFAELSNLRLSRQVVQDTFRRCLRREPAERNILGLQGYPDQPELEALVKGSKEYRLLTQGTNPS